MNDYYENPNWELDHGRTNSGKLRVKAQAV
jgi:hypothetical protein